MREAGYLNSENMQIKTFLQQAGELLHDGAALIIYPEGTRSSTGELGRFHSGAFLLAMKYNVPIVPMCIAGTGSVFPKGKSFGKPAQVRVTLMEQVNPTAFKHFGDTAHIHMQRYIKTVMKDALTHFHDINKCR